MISWRQITFLPAILFMIVIFGFSSEGGTRSAGMSYTVAWQVVEIGNATPLFDWTEEEKELIREKIHTPIRKIAHMSEYALLCILWILPLGYCFPTLGIRKILIALSICLIYAVLDEWHQTFVPGREGKWMDVGIDLIGAMIGSLLFQLGQNMVVRRKIKCYNKNDRQSDFH